MSYEDIECPYCGYEYDLNHDDGAFYNENEPEVEECPECEKKYLVHSSMSWDFNGEKADCLNDGNHNWVKEYPEIYTRHNPALMKREMCDICGEKRVV